MLLVIKREISADGEAKCEGRSRGDREKKEMREKKEDIWSLIQNKLHMTYTTRLNILVFQIFF